MVLEKVQIVTSGHADPRLVVLLALSLNVSCGKLDPCENKVALTATSPDGHHRVVVFDRGCGATVGFLTQVSILSGHERFTERSSWLSQTRAGNTLSLDGVAVGPAGPTVQAKWIDGRSVDIAYEAGRRVHWQYSEVGDVHVTFRAVVH